MRNIKYRTIFLSLALVALSFFLVAKVAVNFDANGDRQAATTINSDLSEAPVPNPRRQNNNNLDELYQQAAAAQPDLARLTQEFADRFGGEALIPETLKARQRAEEKIAADYGGDAARITDLVRSSVIFETESQVTEALDIIRQDMNVIRVKDRFQSPVNGYRDVLLNIRMPNGHIAEMQLHLRSILDVKYKFGDKLYNEIRTIEADAKQAQRDLTPAESRRIEQLSSQAQQLYDEAFAQSQS
ncbi:MAG: hypothetical protein AAFO85_16925 [Cyanobacteria bacterium J06598_4]